MKPKTDKPLPDAVLQRYGAVPMWRRAQNARLRAERRQKLARGIALALLIVAFLRLLVVLGVL